MEAIILEDIKSIVAKNITDLRLLNNMTQMELAEKLNYSDKTVSKWERGESTPDISVLVEISDIFGVTLDYLVGRDTIEDRVRENKKKESRYNHRVITYIVEGSVWFIAFLAFIITTLIVQRIGFQWLYLVYATPIVMIIRLVFNSIWFNPRHNYVIISMLMWSILATIHLTFWHFGINVALIYLVGIAGELIIILWSFLKKPKK